MKPADAARKVARLTHSAVEHLSRGDVLDLAQVRAEDAADIVEAPALTPAEEAKAALDSLSGRFDAERVERPVSWYFSLGDLKYSVAVSEDACSVFPVDRRAALRTAWSRPNRT